MIARTAVLATALTLGVGAAFGHGSSDQKKKHSSHTVKPTLEEKTFGRPGDRAKTTRTISVDMSDAMQFAPAEIEVRQDDTIRFVVKNSGKQMHEMVLGSMAELKEHHALMQKYLGMEHEEAYMAHVPPGKSGTIVWQFTKSGEFNFACLIPGHFEAGMIGRITVKAR